MKIVAFVTSTWLLLAPSPQVSWQPVAPGVEYAQVVRDVPWSIHLLRVDPSEVRLDVVHARNRALGLDTVSTIARETGAIAAINGGYFRMTGDFAGDSTGTLQIDGRLFSEPDRGRAAIGFARTATATRVVMGHVAWRGIVKAGTATRRLNGLNRPRRQSELVLFTPDFEETTLTDEMGTEALVRDGRVVDIRDGEGSTRIPSNGFVLSATGTARSWMRANLRPGTVVTVATGLVPVNRSTTNVWKDAEDILGAGPKLVTAGRIDITSSREKMAPAFRSTRHPRTAIASLADGRVLLLVVDGRQPLLSAGMSLDELARFLLDQDAVEAINLDGGGSTTMVVKGDVVNHPSDPTGERRVSDAVLVRPARR
jgi:exopolysaccharide biosynthesis protein